jgi:hemoglobin-like flavoprotein
MDDQTTLLRASWARIEPRVPALLPAFAARVPGMRELSPRAAAEATDACAALVAALDDPRRLVRDVVALARRHDVPAADCPLLAEAFLHTLDGAPGVALTREEREAWGDAARLVCSIAQRAARRGRAAPAVTAPSPPALA